MEEFSENYPKGQNPKKYDVKAMNKHYLEETGRKFNLNKNKDSIDDEDCRVGCTTNGCQAKPTPTSSETDTKWADEPKPLRPNVQLCTDWSGLQKTGDMNTTCLNNPKCDSDAALKSAEAFKAPRDTTLKKGCRRVATLDDPDLTQEKCWALQRSIDPKVYHHRDITLALHHDNGLNHSFLSHTSRVSQYQHVVTYILVLRMPWSCFLVLPALHGQHMLRQHV